MFPDQILPAVGKLLQRRYVESRRQFLTTTPYPWPKRRVKRKPLPGVLDLADAEMG